MLLYGTSIDADTALKWGLIDDKRPNHRTLLWLVRKKLAEQICSNAPNAMRAQKLLIRRWEEIDLQAGIAASVDVFAASFADGGVECKKYIQKYLEERKTIAGVGASRKIDLREEGGTGQTREDEEERSRTG